jgi:hypothetical protein
VLDVVHAEALMARDGAWRALRTDAADVADPENEAVAA